MSDATYRGPLRSDGGTLPGESSAVRCVVIGGCPRSGTRLVQDILDSHPDVVGGPEFDHLPDLVHLWARMNRAAEVGRTSFFYDGERLRRAFATLIAELLLRVAGEHGVSVVSEKTPGNVAVFPELAELLPSARFVAVIRDPRAVAASLLSVRERALARGQRPSRGWSGLPSIIGTIRVAAEATARSADELGDRLHALSYEDLVNNPSYEIGRLCEFLDLEFDDAMLHPDRVSHDRAVGSDQSVWRDPTRLDQPIDPSMANSWRGRLSPWQVGLIEAGLRDLSVFDHYWDEPDGHVRMPAVAARWVLRVQTAVTRLRRRLPGQAIRH